MGGKAKGKRGRGADKKSPVIGLLERQGSIKAKVVQNTQAKTIEPFILENVEPDSTMMTDEYRSYSKVSKLGYKHKVINHGRKEYVVNEVHVNGLEGFWSQLKRSVNGTYHAVSPKYLQNYVDEFSYRYNQRASEQPVFYPLISKACKLD